MIITFAHLEIYKLFQTIRPSPFNAMKSIIKSIKSQERLVMNRHEQEINMYFELKGTPESMSLSYSANNLQLTF